MKNSLPTTGILRGIPSFETHPSPKQRSGRRLKSGSENIPPSDLNTIMEPTFSSSMASKQSASKVRSPLPPRPPPSNPNPLKRKLMMETVPENGFPTSSDSGVKVVVRMRAFNQEEEGEQIVQKLSENSLSILNHVFTFDSVADTDSTQQDIFELVGVPLVENCLAGFNSSIFAYGQTGSGKTYTMWGPSHALAEQNSSSNHQKGLTPRVFEQLFARMKDEEVKHADQQLNYQCRCSFLEIYNEQITDLLDPDQRNLQIREVKSGVYVENLTEAYICTVKEITQLLTKGLANRRTGATSINAESSRSHSVFTCVVESRCKSMTNGLSSLRISRINLVDLAGSERQKLTGAAGERLKEAGNINRSLSHLGNLINILAEVSQSGKQRHIPYRDSRLTFLLQDSLGGNAKMAMICAISPAQSCKSETFSTLRFAQRAKAIKNQAIVNEVLQDDPIFLREVIRQLKDELLRVKSNGNSTDGNGVSTTGWNARKSLQLLRLSLHRPMTLPHVEDDSDEEMEIDEDDVEKLCTQVGSQLAACEEKIINYVDKLPVQSDTQSLACEALKDSRATTSNGCDQDFGNAKVSMKDHQLEEMGCHQLDKHVVPDGHEEDVVNVPVSSYPGMLIYQNDASNNDEKHMLQTNAKLHDWDLVGDPVEEMILVSPECKLLNKGLIDEPVEEKPFTCLDSKSDVGKSHDIAGADPSHKSPTSSLNSVIPSSLSIVPCQLSPVLQSPTLSVSPRVDSNSRKSLRTSSMLSASQKDLSENNKPGPDVLNVSNAPSTRTSKNSLAPTESLAASLHRGLQILGSHQQNSAMKRSSFRFSFKPVDLNPFLSVEKVHVGVQTLSEDIEVLEDPSAYICSYCKNRSPQLDCTEADNGTELRLVPVDGSQVVEKSKKQVPKAVEKVLAGAIRREMALEEFCAKQASEIAQLNRLVQQYKHERECNAIIEQTREDKIRRLEGLMDGVLPTAEYMEEELVSITNQYELLKEKYEYHPEVLRMQIEIKRVQNELDGYKNFFDMGERDVLMEEIQHLRRQLQYYVDSSPLPTRKQSSLLQLTYQGEQISAPLSTMPESTEKSAEEKFEQERRRWTETESKWISLSEELRLELEASRSLAEKQKQELDSEKKCIEELKEALEMAMQGHARILEQYAELEEKHISLLGRHRKIRDGVADVKKATGKAGVKGALSKFIDSFTTEISALKAEREKERRHLKEENKGLQAQLRDTADAVEAAGELLVRLKEAEEAAAVAQKRALMAEQEAGNAHEEIDKLKRKHQREISTLNQFLAESRLPKEALRPEYSEAEMATKYREESLSDQRWREEFEPCSHGGEGEFSKIAEPSSWFSGYDRCNI
ncbi:kinesin-like protein KIN-12B isoform X2 [Tasmannia lanceolata]|uniref:kinesin-like protein KIN-12B isoform X2 n=1 Tax=Tasmannia lanceolata TaxID=3420 RepID=UPI004064185E